MRIQELFESRNTPCIIVDVQPAYQGSIDFDIGDLCKFIARQTGPILMFVNADETGMTDDNVEYDVLPWWEEQFENVGLDFYEHGFGKMEFFDKGYGYLRGWMDQMIAEGNIIKTIREMYRQKVTDSRELFDGEDSETYVEDMAKLNIPERVLDDAISVEWVSIAKLREYNGGYIMGGARTECLRELELLMNAFNIKYKRIKKFVYG